jgi:hypothetical protein
MSNFVHTPHQTRLSLRHLTFLVVFALTAATLTAFTASRTADASSSAGFNPIVPRRVMDTRSGFGGPVFGPGMTRQLSLAATVPAGATGVVLNLAATEPTANTFITVWPAGNPRPTSSNLNVQAGQTRANAVIVGLSTDRTISLYTHLGTTHLVVDVMGYFVGEFNGINPTRVMDTRSGLGAARMGPATTRSIKVIGTAQVPDKAIAVALNVTAVNATRPTFVTVHATDIPRPRTSNLNVTSRAPVPNLVVTAVGPSGQVSLYNHAGSVDAVVDIMGYFVPGGTFTSLIHPARVLDTREGTCGLRLGPGETRQVRMITTNPASVSLNVTAVDATHNTFLTVFPTGTSRPTTSNVNVRAGSGATPNFVMVGTGTANEISIYNHHGTVDVVVDQFGATYGPTKPGTPTKCVPASPTPPPFAITGATYLYAQPDENTARALVFYYRNSTTTNPCSNIKTALINDGWNITRSPCTTSLATATQYGFTLEAGWTDVAQLITVTVFM